MRFSKLVVAVSVCAFSALGGGCSGSSDGGGAATVGPVTLDQFPQTLANALCDSVAPCCKAANLPYLDSGCRGAATDGWSTFIAQMSSGHTRYDADAAGRCVAAVKNDVASCKELGDAAQAACTSVFVGTVAIGGACDPGSTDCVPGAACAVDLNSINGLGVCQASGAGGVGVHGHAGDSCLGSCIDVAGQPQCQSSFASGATNTPANAGFCYQSDGVFCSYQTQTCDPLIKLGEACIDGGCVSGAYCNDARVCSAQSDSGPCGDTPDACSAKSYCDLGQCFAKKQDHFGCQMDAECASGACVPSPSAGVTESTCGAPSIATPAICSGQTKPSGQ